MNEQISTGATAAFCAALLAGLGWPALLNADPAGGKPGPRYPYLKSIELEGNKGTFVHETRIAPGDSLALQFHTEGEIQQVLGSLKLEPDRLLFVRWAGDMLPPDAAKLFPDLFGYSDKASGIKTEALWKKLLGKQVVLGVEEEGLSGEVGATLNRDPSRATLLQGALGARTRSRREIEGTLVGYAKGAGQEPDILRILAGDGRKLIEVPRTAVVSFDVSGELAEDLQQAVALLQATCGAGLWGLTIHASGAAPGSKDGARAKITYQLPVRAWEAYLRGTLRCDGRNNQMMHVCGTAQIWNETPYDWTDVDVTLRTARARYLLENVTLPRGYTDRFPITFLSDSGDEKRGDEAKLKIKEKLAVAAPEDVEADKLELPVERAIEIQEGDRHYSVPPGKLAVCHERRKADCTREETPGTVKIPGDVPPGADGKGTKLKVSTDLVVSYARKYERAPVGIEGYRMKYRERRISSFSSSNFGLWRVNDARC